eukprot:CAMPEP_0194527866 /NCGR_PEP_ID=MMETSP0253-20130528/64102_1 /TAXON_ID=2966 /ORGANISM="Noctiluca scintillans" /LENGTH=164 /DNA_ID=CAMNT_0039372861 /DNA_START=293 /DNA_END=784 /DNA_ORIENTATION=-
MFSFCSALSASSRFSTFFRVAVNSVRVTANSSSKFFWPHVLRFLDADLVNSGGLGDATCDRDTSEGKEASELDERAADATRAAQMTGRPIALELATDVEARSSWASLPAATSSLRLPGHPHDHEATQDLHICSLCRRPPRQMLVRLLVDVALAVWGVEDDASER